MVMRYDDIAINLLDLCISPFILTLVYAFWSALVLMMCKCKCILGRESDPFTKCLKFINPNTGLKWVGPIRKVSFIRMVAN